MPITNFDMIVYFNRFCIFLFTSVLISCNTQKKIVSANNQTIEYVLCSNVTKDMDTISIKSDKAGKC
jgi:hypothetical protein